MQKMYSIYYNDGESEKHEVVYAKDKPTMEDAKKFINNYIEGLDPLDIEDGWITIEGIYETAIEDFDKWMKEN